MRFAQILYNKAHWIFEAEEKPEFAQDIILVDITDKPEVQEGWDYDGVNFTAHVVPEPGEVEPSIEEKILFENQYQTILLEMGIM